MSTKISALPAASAANRTDILPAVQSTTTRKATVAQILAKVVAADMADFDTAVTAATQVAANTAAIATNSANIATNSANIASNTSAIALKANTADLGALAYLATITNTQVATGAAIALSKLASVTASRALVSDGSGVVSPSAVTATELGYVAGVTSAIQTQISANASAIAALGTMAAQNANNVTITGGSIAGITDLAVADGGTGASSASAARNNLGLGTAAVADTGTSSGNVPVLDGSGKLNTAVLPALAITEVNVVASQAAMLALAAERGDIAIRSDLNKSFALSSDSPGTLADWKELLTPTDAVLSVAGRTGAITLDAADIASGTIADARFPATLPAASGVNLTALNASNLGSGTVPTARLGSGTANSTTYLRGDQTWATVSAGATTALDNLASVAINTSLLPATTNAIDAGSSSKIFRSGYFGTVFVGPPARTSGAAPYLTVTAPADTGQTASTEAIGASFVGATRQWATGALATQREVVFAQPTYAFVGASTISDAATVAIAGAPIKGTNASFTRTHAMLIQAGATSAPAAYTFGLTVNTQTGGGVNHCAVFLGGNVGIGTNDPGILFEINKSTDSAVMRIGAGAAGGYDFARSTTTGALTLQGTQTGFNNIGLCPTSGSVGVGTAAPGSKFEVAGPIATAWVNKTAAYTLTASDSLVSADAASATFAVTLPTAVGCSGRVYTVKRINSGANAVTIATTSSQTIDGASGKSLDTQWAAVTLYSNGTNWLVRSTLGTVT